MDFILKKSTSRTKDRGTDANDADEMSSGENFGYNKKVGNDIFKDNKGQSRGNKLVARMSSRL